MRAPLTEAQREIWALAQLGEAAAAACHLSCVLNLRGPLARDALARAVQDVVGRHDSLRATVDPLGETQIFAPRLAVDLAWSDLGEVEEAALSERLAVETRRAFDLTGGPLVRCHLIRQSADLHIFVLTVHHIAADGRSLGLLLDEIGRLYAAEAGGAPCTLPVPELFSRYVERTVEWQKGPDMAPLEAFWRQRLALPLSRLELPADRPRPPFPSYRGERHVAGLDPGLAAGSRRLAGRLGSTLLVVLLAAANALLHRLTGQDDLILGFPAADPTLATAPLVGQCLGYLPLRIRLPIAATFTGLVRIVGGELLAAYEHWGYPFGRLVRKLELPSDPGRSPLFSATFNLDRLSVPQIAGLDVELAPSPLRSAAFELDWNALEWGDALRLDCLYSTDRFDPATIERWQGYFGNLLAQAVVHPECPLGELDLLGEAERHQLLRAWNETAVSYPREALIHELMAEQAARTPEAVAVVHRAEHLTYGELDRQADRLAQYLRTLGVTPESRVGLAVERSLDMAVGILGILAAGGAWVPLDPSYPRERLAYLLEDAGIQVLVTQERLLDRLPPQGARVVCLDADRREIGRQPSSRSGRLATSENLAYVIYTSGSTGRPKGVLVSHRPLVQFSLAIRRLTELRPGDRFLQFASLSFDVLLEEVFPAWLVGATVVLPEAGLLLSAAGYSRTLLEQAVTIAELPTAFWHEWVGDLAASGAEVPGALRLLLVGGEKPQPDRVVTWARLGVPLLQVYGLTETTCTSLVHWAPRGPGAPRGDLPIGRPLANTAVYLLDRGGQLTPVGVPGELHLGGEGLARGYHRRPELTAERFLPDPFAAEPGARLYRTGDLARFHPNGEVEFLGRLDHQVKVRGFRVELQEIEAELARHPVLLEAVVTARPGPGGNRLSAYVVPREGQVVDAAELRRFLGERLPAYMVPAAFVFLAALPLSVHGKLDRRALPTPDAAAPAPNRPFAPPLTPAERALARIWESLLEVQQVGVDDCFFELGGDSILALRLLARARQAGLELEPRQVLANVSLAELAAAVGALSGLPGSSPAPASAAGPLTPGQRRLLGRELPEPHHWNLSVLYEVTAPVAPGALERAAAICLARHEALTLRFAHSADGSWRQWIAGVGEPMPFALVDLSRLPERERQGIVELEGDRLQASLDLSRGPLVRFTCFLFGPSQPGRLLLLAHQLGVDFASWRILLEDLDATYDAELRGQEAQLVARTASYLAWAQRLEEHAQGDLLYSELGTWLAALGRRSRPLPLDFSKGDNLTSTAREVVRGLAPDETQGLLDACRSGDTRMIELLLTALVQTLSDWAGEPRLRVDLESHGREHLFSGLDLSRTVGWFSFNYPVLLDLSGVDGSEEALARIAQQLRAVPNGGIGFGLLRHLCRRPGAARAMATLPAAEVSFSYREWLSTPRDETRLVPVGAPRGPSRSPQGRRSHLLEVEADLFGDRLWMQWGYSTAVHRRETIEALAEGFTTALLRQLAV